MDSGEWIAAGSGRVGALIGAGAGYAGAMRAAKRAAAAAWAANTMTVAQALLDSDDHRQRELGTRLLTASVGAIADADDTPERIKQVTRGAGLMPAVDQVRNIGGSEGDVTIEVQDGDGEDG